MLDALVGTGVEPATAIPSARSSRRQLNDKEIEIETVSSGPHADVRNSGDARRTDRRDFDRRIVGEMAGETNPRRLTVRAVRDFWSTRKSKLLDSDQLVLEAVGAVENNGTVFLTGSTRTACATAARRRRLAEGVQRGLLP